MNQELKQAKQMIRPYLQSISEDALIRLTAMAQDGEVQYWKMCRCIRGIVGGCTVYGYRSQRHSLALTAERGLEIIGQLGWFRWFGWSGDPKRNLILYPMCRAELRRRGKLTQDTDHEHASDGVGTRTTQAQEMVHRQS